jgi:predicted Rdx family selenoprotein
MSRVGVAKVEIFYCLEQAASLAAELRAQGLDANGDPGRADQFDVVADGRLVFSKQHIGRFPEPGEVLAALSS